jgi:hypothetical protein
VQAGVTYIVQVCVSGGGDGGADGDGDADRAAVLTCFSSFGSLWEARVTNDGFKEHVRIVDALSWRRHRRVRARARSPRLAVVEPTPLR